MTFVIVIYLYFPCNLMIFFLDFMSLSFLVCDIGYILLFSLHVLQDHWRFLRTVALKLFEFMHETFPGVQEMVDDISLLFVFEYSFSCILLSFPPPS